MDTRAGSWSRVEAPFVSRLEDGGLSGFLTYRFPSRFGSRRGYLREVGQVERTDYPFPQKTDRRDRKKLTTVEVPTSGGSGEDTHVVLWVLEIRLKYVDSRNKDVGFPFLFRSSVDK